MPAPCELLEWDSDFFGKRIARVVRRVADAEAVAEILAWREREAIDCLYLLVQASDDTAIRLAETMGFHLVDLRVTLSLDLVAGERATAPQPTIRPVQNSDWPALLSLARSLHHDTRFFVDGHFSRERCETLYAIWLEQCGSAPCSQVWVAEQEGQPAGYIACQATAAGEGRISLLGVAPSRHRQGLGSALVRTGLDWCAGVGLRTVSVVTQGRNIRALRLYQRYGFSTSSLEFWYHLWRPARPPAGTQP